MRCASILAALLVSGCSILGSRDLHFAVPPVGPILACVEAPGGDCKPAAASTMTPSPRALQQAAFAQEMVARSEHAVSRRLPSEAMSERALSAAKVLAHPTTRKLHTFYERVAGIDTAAGPPPAISASELAAYVTAVHEAATLDGWAELRAYVTAHGADRTIVESTVVQLTLMEGYLSAYFSNGDFVSLDIDPTKLVASAEGQLKSKLKLTDEEAKQLTGNLVSQVVGNSPGEDGIYHVLVKAKDGGFVTRGGAKYTFPGVSLTVDPTAAQPLKVSKIDFTQVGSDVVRVVIEAAADGWGQLPADSSSTACTLKKAKQLDNYKQLKCYVEADQKVDAKGFAKVNDTANRSESYAATATGQAIRGASWVSLNNEALAKLLETAVGVVARKAAEKVTWCYLACKANPQVSATLRSLQITTIPLSWEP